MNRDLDEKVMDVQSWRLHMNSDLRSSVETNFLPEAPLELLYMQFFLPKLISETTLSPDDKPASIETPNWP